MNKQKGFTLVELLVVIAILGVLATIGLTAFNSSQAKGRDAKRKNDLVQVSKSLELYFNDYGKYPSSDATGKIKGCGANGAEVCTWNGEFSATKTGSTSPTIYMKALPIDPTSSLNYFYVGSSTNFKLYAFLENSKDPNIVSSYTNSCGAKTCNYGISSANTSP